MTQVTPSLIKSLREMTGAGLTDCKKALDEALGNIDKAVIVLREKGLAAAAKKADRTASEGTVQAVISSDHSYAALYELNCETDFVTRNDDFQNLNSSIAEGIKKALPQTLEEVLAVSVNGSSIQSQIDALIAKIGEKIQLRRFIAHKGSWMSSYIHGLGKIGILVEFASPDIEKIKDNALFHNLTKDIALQAAALKPQYLKKEEIPQTLIDSESQVFETQYRNQGKPEAALPKIVAGRLETWFKECCLNEQPFVKEDKKSVSQHIADVAKTLGASLELKYFVRYELGQGIEKKTGDLAKDVAEQISQVTSH